MDRDGQAITGVLPSVNRNSGFSVADPESAAYKVRYDNYSEANPQAGSWGHDYGLLVLDGRDHTSANTGDMATSLSSVDAAVANLVPMDVLTDSVGGGTTFTLVPKDAPALAISATQIQISAPNYFGVFTATAMRIGRDRIMVTRADGSKRLFTITSLDNPTTVSVAENMGLNANEAVTVQWYALRAAFGGSNNGNTGPRPGPLAIYADSLLSDADDGQQERIKLIGGGVTSASSVAIELGQHIPDQAASYGNAINGEQLNLFLSSRGDITSYFGPQAINSGVCSHAFQHRAGPYVFNDQPQSLAVDPANASQTLSENGNGLTHFVGGCVGAPGITPVITFDVLSQLEDGTELRWTWQFSAGCDATFVWDSDFRFSDAADGQPGAFAWRGAVVWKGLLLMPNLYDPCGLP